METKMNEDLICCQLEAFGKCFYYYIDPLLPIIESEDKGLFIRKAVDKLDKQINLFHYDLVLFPKMRSRECQYMIRYIYRFNQPRLYNFEDVLANPMDGKLCETIRKQNVLVVDDVTTSGSTLKEILRCLRIVNDDNNITIFGLIGRKDLVAESF
jgi:orotate phosphoribosyltransferase